MAKGMRLRLLMQGVIFSRVNAHSFIEYGDDEEYVEKIPYDPELIKKWVQKD